MIIFTHDLNILGCIHNPVIFNLSSYNSNFDSIASLTTSINNIQMQFEGVPPNQYIYYQAFDIAYMNMVLSNNNLFIDLMKVMINAYEGNNVIILVQRDEYRDAIMESLIKLIQVRYGYDCWIVESIEDIECIKETKFTPMGLLTLDEDRKRYIQLYASGQAYMIGDAVENSF